MHSISSPRCPCPHGCASPLSIPCCHSSGSDTMLVRVPLQQPHGESSAESQCCSFPQHCHTHNSPELAWQSSLQQTALGLLIYPNEKGKGQV